MEKIVFQEFKLRSGIVQKELLLSYQLFGQSLHEAPLVVVNHALTGNSNVTGNAGWWQELIGENKCIETQKYCVIAFNIPGNEFQKSNNSIENHKDFSVFDIAALFWEGLQYLKINQVFAIIGGSLGGAIAWEMASIKPKAIQHLIPVATNWKASDWLIANVAIQNALLTHQENPLEKARSHAMLLYRTPQSLALKFNSKKVLNSNQFLVENWLEHHGNALNKRFSIQAYKLMNHLLQTTDVFASNQNFIQEIEATIHLIAVDSDGFFSANEIQETYQKLIQNNKKCQYHEIKSVHGHDAFLIEFEQLNQFLKPLFSNGNTSN